MSMTIAGIEFARVHYDSRGDVLYLNVANARRPPWDAHASEEGHAVDFDDTGRVIGMTIVGARWWLERDGVLNITLAAEDLTPQELAALGSSKLRATEAELAPALKSAA